MVGWMVRSPLVALPIVSEPNVPDMPRLSAPPNTVALVEPRFSVPPVAVALKTALPLVDPLIVIG